MSAREWDWKRLTAVAALLVLGAGLAAAGGRQERRPAPEPVMLEMWWWGEFEAAGMESWVQETVAQYETKNPTVSITTRLQRTDQVIGDFTAASQSGNPPDLQYFWNGIYHMENVWRGYVEPLDDWFSATELEAMDATELSVYEGKQYRVGWYVMPFSMLYNRSLFAEAGIADPPENWDWEGFSSACAKLKQAGIQPLAFGFAYGFFGEWYTGFFLVQQVESLADVVKLVTGESRWSDPRNHEFWSRLESLIRAGYVNADAESLNIDQAIRLFEAGQAGMTAAGGALIGRAEASLGPENVGITKFPIFARGKYSGRAVQDIQGVGISSTSKHKKEAAEFIRFMHAPDRLTAMYEKTNVFPADTRWQGDREIRGANLQLTWKWFREGPAPYLANLLPWDFDEQVEFVAPQLLMAGTHTASDIGRLGDEVMARWREQNPELYSSYQKWFP